MSLICMPDQLSASQLPVVIIGAGLAGLTVALHLAETQPVIVLAKRQLEEAATAWAQGGIVGVLGGLGGFVCPVIFGYLLEATGLWTSCWMFFAVVV